SAAADRVAGTAASASAQAWHTSPPSGVRTLCANVISEPQTEQYFRLDCLMIGPEGDVPCKDRCAINHPSFIAHAAQPNRSQRVRPVRAAVIDIQIPS